MSARDPPDSGQLPGRYEFVPEQTRGEVPTDPDFERFSDSMQEFEADGGASVSRRDATGTMDATGHDRGTEEPALSSNYHLQRQLVTVNFDDPELTSVGETTLGVASSDAGDTSIDVTIYNNDESVSETITTDGSDATTFVTGSTSFASIGRVKLSSAATGDITVSEDASGSAGTAFGTVSAGDTDVDDVVPNGAASYGILRDDYNRMESSITALSRREHPGGNDDAGVREYKVVIGAALESAEPTLDPSEATPILMDTSWQPQKVRSYKIHQPSSATTLTVSSDDSSDTGIDVKVESENANEAETITTDGSDGTTQVSGSTSFPDIDAVWLSSAPAGTITVTDGAGTTLMTIEGGNAYSDDDQPVDGDRGVPVLGAGSRASEIGTAYEYFVGDRFERPSGSPVRPRVNSASWSVENDINTQSIHSTRAPVVDEGNRTVTTEADVAGAFVSHDAMMDAVQKDQANHVHELSSQIVVFRETTPTGSPAETRSADQAVATLSETFEAHETANGPAIDFLRRA